MAKRSSSEFVNLTLTEFLMVVIFILITLLFYSFSKSKAVEVEALLTPEEIEQLAANATKLNDELFGDTREEANAKKELTDFFEHMDKAMAKRQRIEIAKNKQLPEIWDTLVAKEREVAELQDMVTELTDAVKDQADKERLNELARKKARLKGELERLKQEQARYKPLFDRYGVSNTEEFVKVSLEHLVQYEEMVKRTRRQGVGNPLCWLDADGSKEFLFHIDVLEDSTFRVTPIYPESREADLQAMGYPVSRKPRVFTMQQFKDAMQRFWDYGQAHYGCRFFVKVQDRTKTKVRWKDGLALVENYFYKQEVK